MNDGNQNASAKILAVVEDLIFASKIQQTAKLAGVRIAFVQPRDIAPRIAVEPVRAVILDLNHRSGQALEVLRAVKTGPAPAETRTIGFVSHVQAEVIEAARASGCDLVLARSAFTEQLPELLRKLAAPGTTTPEKL